jgi:hypothetical protein
VEIRGKQRILRDLQFLRRPSYPMTMNRGKPIICFLVVKYLDQNISIAATAAYCAVDRAKQHVLLE